jgi:hypothetical protein
MDQTWGLGLYIVWHALLQERQARAALKTAAAKLMAVDADTYLSIDVEQAPLGGWRLLAIRRAPEAMRARRELLQSLAS